MDLDLIFVEEARLLFLGHILTLLKRAVFFETVAAVTKLICA